MTTAEKIERKYRLSKVKAEDYILPANDGKTIYRVATYWDGPSQGLDIAHDRKFWGVWRWTGKGRFVDTEDWERFDLIESLCDTRAEAIQLALRR